VSGLDEVLKRPLSELLPHREPMILLTRAVGLEGNAFVAEVDIAGTSPFFEGGGVPVWIGVEYMAQTVALFAGAEGAGEGHGSRPGLLLGTRAYTCAREFFFDGETLRIVVRKILTQDNGISAMDCLIEDASKRELARAQLTVIQLPDMAALDALARP
jgi:predicted hotdog family 3-hydroxylacyl-ACP dehydratase